MKLFTANMLALTTLLLAPGIPGFCRAESAATNLPSLTTPSTTFSKPVAEVVKLVQSGVGDEVVLAFVANAPAAYRLSANDILALKEVSVSPQVVSAMIAHDSALRRQSVADLNAGASAPPVAPTNPPLPASFSTPSPSGTYSQKLYAPTTAGSTPSGAIASAPTVAPAPTVAAAPAIPAPQSAAVTPAPATVIVEQAPPPPQVEVIPAAPSVEYCWTPGYWSWRGHVWVWVPGVWVLPPRHGSIWIGGHWETHGRGHIWIGGRWR